MEGNHATLRGPQAELRHGYYKAAILGAWTLTLDAVGGTLTARVLKSDAFRLGQPGLTFRVVRQTGQWEWPVLTVSIAGHDLTATVGPQE